MTKDQVKNTKRWIKALRSGKYKKTKGVLSHESTGAFCALGVAEQLIPASQRGLVPRP